MTDPKQEPTEAEVCAVIAEWEGWKVKYFPLQFVTMPEGWNKPVGGDCTMASMDGFDSEIFMAYHTHYFGNSAARERVRRKIAESPYLIIAYFKFLCDSVEAPSEMEAHTRAMANAGMLIEVGRFAATHALCAATGEQDARAMAKAIKEVDWRVRNLK